MSINYIYFVENLEKNIRMLKTGLMLFLLLGISCTSESTLLSNKEKVSIDFLSEHLWNKSYLATLYYEKYGTKTIWQDPDDRQELIDFLLNRVENEGLTLTDYNIEDLAYAHSHYQELNYSQHLQSDFDFTHHFLLACFQLEFGKIDPTKIYSDWEISKPRKVDVDLLHEAIDLHQVYASLEKKIPNNPFYKDLQKEWIKVSDKHLPKAKKILVNLERSRWLPTDMGEYYVWINLPEERLRVYENGTPTQEHRVIIGKPDRKTPVLSSVLNQVVINPTWTVPPTILKNDVVPKATASRGYFYSQRLKIIDKNTGNTVSPEDWDPSRYNSYRYVQATGNLNALGLIKFNFPNKHMVYLHDTNNRSMFNQKNRALSSGCVRVEDPFRLAEKVLALEENKLTRSDLDSLVKKEKTKYIELKKIVHIHQTYLTAYVENGQLKQFHDVYDLDEGLFHRLTR